MEPPTEKLDESLTLETIPVDRVEFGDHTELRGGTLVVSKDELLETALADPRIVDARLELVEPGESTRVTAIKDVIEPRVKLDGPGQVYPGVLDRDVTAVGSGVTRRISGIAVTLISPLKSFNVAAHGSGAASGQPGPGSNLFDMSGPGADASPYGSLRHLCLQPAVDPNLALDDQNWALQGAALRVSDLVARAVLDAEPAESEQFDTSFRSPQAPGIGYIACMNSPQHYSDSLEAYGVSIYGLTRQTPPWVLRPTELLDGAISCVYSWQMCNNPTVIELLRRHRAGVCNFVGVIAVRTRWSSQAEKDVTSNQVARIARDIGADGVVVTWDAGGNDFMEVARAVQACERAGVSTVLLTGEEDPQSGGPALLEPLPEMTAIVSSGVGGNMWFERTAMPAVERVVGPETVRINFGPDTPLVDVDAHNELETLQWEDHYGFGKRTCLAY